VLLNGAETAAESHRIAAETWSARAVEAEAKLEAARQKIESLRVEAGNNHAAAASWMDQHDGLAKRMRDVQDENKRLHAQAIENAREYNTLRDNFSASMRRADAAQAIADQATSVVLDRDKEIAGLIDLTQGLNNKLAERDNDLYLRTAERDRHMKRCDEMVRLAREGRAELSGRIDSLQLDLDDALLVVQEQSHDIVGLVKAVSRAEREVQELRSRRAKGE
jgi:chromosome segregation ATPase